ncbi:MAG: penicillin acylase family protein, partial [Solirubrobacteraceae bacterium]
LAGAIATLTAWNRSGAHRRDRDNSGTYEDAEAVRIMDAWWPRLVKAFFEPTMGPALYPAAIGEEIDNAPNNHGDHLGSAYQDGAYSVVQKDLRTIARRRVRGRFAVRFCGGGNLLRCRAALVASLQSALGVSAAELYRTDDCANGDQRCYDEVRFRPLGGVTQKPIHWINRPTYQQAVEIQGHRAR